MPSCAEQLICAWDTGKQQTESLSSGWGHSLAGEHLSAYMQGCVHEALGPMSAPGEKSLSSRGHMTLKKASCEIRSILHWVIALV